MTSAEEDETKDQLIVGSTLDFEPFEYGKIGEYYGIDMELVSHLADYLGKELVIVNSNFETMFMSVSQHKCDICIGGISINEARREYMDFSDPYYRTYQCLIVPEDNTEFDGLTTPEEVEAILRSKDKSTIIGVENQTTAQFYCEGDSGLSYSGFPVSVKKFRDTNVAIDAMLEGKADYVMGDAASVRFWKKLDGKVRK